MTRRAEEKVYLTFYSFPEGMEELPVGTNVFPTGFINRKRYWEGPRIQICEEDPSSMYADYWTEEILD